MHPPIPTPAWMHVSELGKRSRQKEENEGPREMNELYMQCVGDMLM